MGVQRKGSQGLGISGGLEGDTFAKLCLVVQGHMD